MEKLKKLNGEKRNKNDEKITIFDTTLRDGEQSPGCAMTLEEKVRMALLLEELGVDVIEAGFPVASLGDFKSIDEIAKNIKNSTVCALARTVRGDIESAGKAIESARRGRIHTFISTSPLHMKHKLNMSPEGVLDAIGKNVAHARTFTDDVEWSAEDASRTEDDFLCRTVETAIRFGATTINIPDTVGYSTPEEYGAKIAMLFNRVPNIDKAIISTHCHNDLGLAVANSLAGVANGARQVECTINGIGERAGNAALEEIAMILHTRSDIFPFNTNIDTTKITKISRALSEITGFNVQPNKAVVGENAFAHASGIHQDGMLKNVQTYEIMTPESVGLNDSKLIMTKHSGRHALDEKFKELGFDLDENALKEAFFRFKVLADLQKEISNADLIALVSENATLKNGKIREAGSRSY